MATFYLLATVALGGALGAIVRAVLQFGWPVAVTPPVSLFTGTLLCNVVGSFLIGLVGPALVGENVLFNRNLVIVGFLGSFTTMSSAAYEAILFFEQHRFAMTAGYWLLTSAGSLGACLIGFWSYQQWID